MDVLEESETTHVHFLLSLQVHVQPVPLRTATGTVLSRVCSLHSALGTALPAVDVSSWCPSIVCTTNTNEEKVCVRDRVERRRGHYGRSGSIFGYPRRRVAGIGFYTCCTCWLQDCHMFQEEEIPVGLNWCEELQNTTRLQCASRASSPTTPGLRDCLFSAHRSVDQKLPRVPIYIT